VLLILAKAPVPGQAKTRLAARVGPEVAADLAAAALLDTLDLVDAAFPGVRPVVAWTGSLDRAARRAEVTTRLRACTVVPQRGDTFGQRLANAHADLPPGSSVLQIGMDTPHLDVKHLLIADQDLRAHEAVIGPAEDGGWWLLGLADPSQAAVLADVPMSRPDTCDLTMAALAHLDLFVTTGAYDVDTHLEAERAAMDAPQSRFARAWRAR
jgi:glycosyltransferase A (GT-A) superfamily protein (DUF2064 family)